MGWYILDSFGTGKGPVVGSFKHINESVGSIKCWEILELISDWQLLKKDSAIWN
jgi:hypothetical protein